MSDDELKVGEELINISQMINNSKDMVDEALQLFQSTMSEFNNEYLGNASDDDYIYTAYYAQDLNKLSEFYNRASAYVLYAFRAMNFTDEEVSGMIEKSVGLEV